MDLGISGRVAMVAAASQGIGLATAKALAQAGCKVSICARNSDRLKAAAIEIGPEVHHMVVDVTQGEDLSRWHQAVVDKWGQVDIVVTNTGGPPAGNWTEKSDAEWQLGVDSTLLNVVRLVRLVDPGMRQQAWGRIIHVTSLVAKEPSPLLPISSTLRAGLMALTRLQSTELAPHGITVNGVLPGHTMTDRQVHLAEIRAGRESITVEEALNRQAKSVPAGRLGKPEEIADAIAFLASERAAYITGINLLVDGGLTKGIA